LASWTTPQFEVHQVCAELDGFAVCIYANAVDFLASGSVADLQCLIVDKNMPRMTGLELIVSCAPKA
jgi:FixJ family two-component response regulator